jgi:serine/threonine protein phosphatase 1
MGKRVFAIGDIHGQLDCLKALHRKIQSIINSEPTHRYIIVYLGDYIDRGLQSKDVIDCLISTPLQHAESFFLKGNHEQALLNFLDGSLPYDRWLRWGGDATLRSYGVNLASPAANAETVNAMRQELSQKIPASHHQFLNSLKLMHDEGDYVFVHAGIRPNVPLDKQLPEDLLMIRDDFIGRPLQSEKMIIHGHTIFPQPYIRERSIGIDTGAYTTGILTAISLEDDRYEFITTK